MQKRQTTNWIPLVALLVITVIGGIVTFTRTGTVGFAVAVAAPKDCTSHPDCGANGGCAHGKCLMGTSVCPWGETTECSGGFCFETPGGAQLSITYPEYHTASKFICLPGHIRDYVRDGGFCKIGRYETPPARSGCRPQHLCYPLPQNLFEDAGMLWVYGQLIQEKVYTGQYQIGICMPPNPGAAAQQANEQLQQKIQAPTCGNGQIDAGEECDIGRDNPDAPCTQSFTLSACKANCECSRPVGGGQANSVRCGNSQVDPGEECDWSAAQNTCGANKFCYGCQCERLS